MVRKKKKKVHPPPLKGTVIFAPSERKLGQERKKRTFTSSIKWVTLSGALVYVVLSGARARETEGCRGDTRFLSEC